ncbi:hypothetical protein C8Q70DRAFT_333215 [Cubamyces menziesii]|nr:hypothetical protein C8Q70DRAFT_333215 [Cubamyces menziesii]
MAHEFDFSNEFVEVVLDTGCSLSYAPPAFVQALQRDVFPQGKTSPAHTFGQHWQPEYTVPSSVYPLNQWVCEVTFAGKGGEPVTVALPCDPFLATFDPAWTPSDHREGLICSIPVSRNTSMGHENFWRFGLPFFQSSYVALHQPKPPMPPYVRFASQWSGERMKYRLPDYAP